MDSPPEDGGTGGQNVSPSSGGDTPIDFSKGVVYYQIVPSEMDALRLYLYTYLKETIAKRYGFEF